jgi:lysophospholipase L1-like esterase
MPVEGDEFYMPSGGYKGAKGKGAKRNGRRGSVALNVLILVSLLAALVLLCFYLYLDGKGEFAPPESPENPSGAALPSETVIITSRETAPETEPPTGQEETSAALPVTESEAEPSSAPAEPAAAQYDKDFFQNHLFIGDSISTGLSGYDCLPAQNVFAQIGLNPDSVMTTALPDYSSPDKKEKTALQRVYDARPEYINIMLGTNGIAYMNGERMAERMSLFIDALRETSPDSRLVLISLPPVTAAYDASGAVKMADIIDYNQRLQALAEEKDCLYVDLFAALCDDTGYFSKDYAEADGMHFKKVAYSVMLGLLQSELTEA